MTSALAATSPVTSSLVPANGPYFTREQIDLVKSQIARGCSDGELGLFLRTCERLRLDPFARQICLVKRRTKDGDVATTQVTIDGFRVVAERSDLYAGQTAPQWCGADGVWRDVWLGDGLCAARVGVYRKDFHDPIYGVAVWESFVQLDREGRPTKFWSTMPDIMLAKCAEAQALRKAFPNDLSGLYTTDEMGQAQNRTIDVEPVREPRRSTTPQHLIDCKDELELREWIASAKDTLIRSRPDEARTRIARHAEKIGITRADALAWAGLMVEAAPEKTAEENSGTHRIDDADASSEDA